MKRDLGVRILTADDAVAAFGPPKLRDPKEMRAADGEAFRRIHEIFAAQGLMLRAMIRKIEGKDGTHTK